MKVKRFEWEGVESTNWVVRRWTLDEWPRVDVAEIEAMIIEAENRDSVLRELTAQFDATDAPITDLELEVDVDERERALAKIEPGLRESLEVAAANIELVAEELLDTDERTVQLPQGQVVTVRDVPVRAAGIYAPGGRAAYPSSVLMCAIPARVAGVERIALATPPGADGKVNTAVLAAAALCGVDEVFAVGGAQAIFALAHGTETIAFVDVVAGPGNAWVRAAKEQVAGLVAIDSLAGPSELMVVLDAAADPRWIALDLCAQAEHGEETPLVAVSVDPDSLDRLATEVERVAESRSGVPDAPLALVQVPDLDAAIAFANRFVPEHLELHLPDAARLAQRITTAGCVFAGPFSATAFGDYVAGSNHVLPTSGAGRFSGPLGPGTFLRKIATVEVSAKAAAELAPHVETIAKAEGFPVHGESAMIRLEKGT
jgi:histidinol dehydrogenase